MSEIKIFVACHNAAHIPHNDLLQPIQVGTALSPYRLSMLHDNEGDNISHKNNRYCELTALYWAWKNEPNCEYYGFFHYRRYLSFTPENMPESPWEGINVTCLDGETLARLHLNEADMRSVIERHDICISKPVDLTDKPYKTVYKQYKYGPEHKEEDLIAIAAILEERYPEIKPYWDMHMRSSDLYMCNLFIFRKEIFHVYCSFLFDVLAEHEKQLAGRFFSEYSARVSGFLAERLLGAFFLYYTNEKKATYKELPTVTIRCPNFESKIVPLPEFESSKTVPVILACNNSYMPYTAALIESIITFSSPDANYDIIILNHDIDVRNKELLQSMLVGHDNIRVRFFGMSHLIAHYKDLFLSNHLTIETYFRLFIPEVLDGYDKVMYLDCDMIVQEDIKKLFEHELGDYAVAGVRDINLVLQYSANHPLYSGKKCKDYVDEVLRKEDPYDYFSAGVLLINMEKWRKANSERRLIEYALDQQYAFHDQDILNIIFQKQALLLPEKWNLCAALHLRYLITDNTWKIYERYLVAENGPAIVHFSWIVKPWYNPWFRRADLFWAYSRKTPFYELALSNFIGNVSEEIIDKSLRKRKTWLGRFIRLLTGCFVIVKRTIFK